MHSCSASCSLPVKCVVHKTCSCHPFWNVSVSSGWTWGTHALCPDGCHSSPQLHYFVWWWMAKSLSPFTVSCSWDMMSIEMGVWMHRVRVRDVYPLLPAVYAGLETLLLLLCLCETGHRVMRFIMFCCKSTNVAREREGRTRIVAPNSAYGAHSNKRN